jgi:hypothetical protein
MQGIIPAAVIRLPHGRSQPKPTAFADYCCELLASVGPCERKRMFGGFGISTGA